MSAGFQGQDFWYLVMLLINCLGPVCLVFLMTEFKCSQKASLLILIGISAGAAALSALLYYTLGREQMMRVFFLLLLLPCLASVSYTHLTLPTNSLV